MTDASTQHDALGAFFDADPVPAVDPGFRVSVMSAIAARRLRVELAMRFALGLALVLLFALTGPAWQTLAASLESVLDLVGLVLAAIAAVALAGVAIVKNRLRIPRFIRI
ncbi:hypothetical protein [Maricaulis sp.]|uniref:hypothetical protein n=1 Tax=Maricaulis sp. TaxID=1486257 RepID=UPI0026126D6A|nr:hypothetical protein [Maricaulis sp.]